MDHDGDVDRLFSWLQMPDLHYREFAGAREVSDAATTWPALRRAVSDAAHEQPAPRPEPAAPAGPSEPLVPSSTPGEGIPQPPSGAALAARLRAAMGRPPPFAGERGRLTDLAEPTAAADRGSPSMAEPEAPPNIEGEAHMRRVGPAYRGFDAAADEPAPEPPPHDAARHSRSLDAVFSRLRAARPYPEMRGRAVNRPGLGPVFRRLR